MVSINSDIPNASAPPLNPECTADQDRSSNQSTIPNPTHIQTQNDAQNGQSINVNLTLQQSTATSNSTSTSPNRSKKSRATRDITFKIIAAVAFLFGVVFIAALFTPAPAYWDYFFVAGALVSFVVAVVFLVGSDLTGVGDLADNLLGSSIASHNRNKKDNTLDLLNRAASPTGRQSSNAFKRRQRPSKNSTSFSNATPLSLHLNSTNDRTHSNQNSFSSFIPQASNLPTANSQQSSSSQVDLTRKPKYNKGRSHTHKFNVTNQAQAKTTQYTKRFRRSRVTG